MYDPNSAQQGAHAGRKLLHSVGFRRWDAKTGTKMLEVWFVVLRDEANTGDEGELVKRSFAMSDAAMVFWGRFCLAMGHTKPHDPQDDDTVADIIGKGPVYSTLKEREYKGETSVEPDSWAAFKGQEDPAWDDMIAKGEAAYDKLEAAFAKKRADGGGASGGGGGGGGAAKPRAAAGGGGGGAEDDIPF